MTLEPEYKNKRISILSVLFPNAKIYLFGSRARGTHEQKSDIDLAIDERLAIRVRNRIPNYYKIMKDLIDRLKT